METEKTGGDPATGASDLDALGLVHVEAGAVPRSASKRTENGRDLDHTCP
jgi:hypothetical protein